MAERSHQEAIVEALQCFSHGSDTLTELSVLDALGSDSGPVRTELDQSDNDLELEECDEEDIGVCDISLTITAPPEETANHSKDSKTYNDESGVLTQDLSLTDDSSDLEADLGNGDLSQSHWNRTATPPVATYNALLSNNDVIPYNSHSDDSECGHNENNTDPKNAFFQGQNMNLNYLLEDSVLAEKFLEYVFCRRYGAADKQCSGNSVSDMSGDYLTVAILNKKLDVVIKRLMEHSVTEQLTSAFLCVLLKASGMPNMRKRMLEHIMLWLNRRQTTFDEPTYRHLKALVLTGLSDVWSVIRKICSSGVSRVFRNWSPKQQEDFFTSILEICINKEGSWQSKDGAALCVHAIMFNCFATNVQNQDVAELPGYIVECVLTIVFSLISHPQLSIRETVTKIMSSYMEHVDSQDMLDLMHQTLTLLTPPSVEKDVREAFHSVEAYAAEGLLNICTSIFKVLPVRKTVLLWLAHRSTFLSYLSNDASSVRQTTSTLCMHVASHGENGVLMKLVMDHLTHAWHVSLETLTQCHHSLKDVDGDTVTWEGKEGRMLVYELLCRHLVDVHTAANNSHPNMISLQSVCSQDGGSEIGQTMEDVYRGVSKHLASQSPLAQLYLLDDATRLADDAAIQILDDGQIQGLQQWLLLHYPSWSNECSEDVSLCKDIMLLNCQDLLLTMLRHTAFCLAHSQWELRRIAQQVLPCLCDVMCLYDVELMMSVWRYITEETSLLSFIGLSALHHSLSLCARVVATVDLTDKDSTPITDPTYVDFVNGVRMHIGNYLPMLCCYLRREAYDKVSLVAAETALLALNFFDLQTEIKEELCEAVLGLWRNLFSFAHPNSAMMNSLFPEPQHSFQSPSEGFLSCCLVRPESDIQCAKQVEKNLMLTIQKHLPHFLPQLDHSSAALCLPLLAHNIGLFIDDTDTCKSLINSFNTLCQCTKKMFAKMASDTTAQSAPGFQPLKCVYFTVRELTAIVALKSLDVALLQKVLNCYLVVCESLQPETHIPVLLQGVAARMSEGGRFPVDSAEGEDVDVSLRWHKPELPPGFGQDLTPQDEDVLELSCTEENESDTSLNRSGSSLGMQLYSRIGRRRTLSTTEDILAIREVATRVTPRNDEDDGEVEEEDEEEEEEDEESDWDSWSEEEQDEEQSVLQTHFRDFFHHLSDFYGAEGRDMLQKEMANFGKEEQDVLKDLISPQIYLL